MPAIVTLPAAEGRRHLFRNASAKLGINHIAVEKDFWLCYTLDCLFQHSPFRDTFTFRGGSSLLKASRLIRRFSEDLDLILDWRVLGYGRDDPWAQRSKTKQNAFNREANARTQLFLRDAFCPAIREDLSKDLGTEINISIEPDDPQVVCFAYPTVFPAQGSVHLNRLEIGPRASWTPPASEEVLPYTAERYPNLFPQSAIPVRTISPVRTFWEKAKILHQEAHRPPHLPLPHRYFRHYHDLHRIAQYPVKARALASPELLAEVAFSLRFYPRAWIKTEEAVPGTMQLYPPEYRIPSLAADYAEMRDLLYGEVPTFHEIMEGIRDLEREINSLKIASAGGVGETLHYTG